MHPPNIATRCINIFIFCLIKLTLKINTLKFEVFCQICQNLWLKYLWLVVYVCIYMNWVNMNASKWTALYRKHNCTLICFQHNTYLSLLTLTSCIVKAIIDILYMWSDTLSGCLTFLYTHPVLGMRCNTCTCYRNKSSRFTQDIHTCFTYF